MALSSADLVDEGAGQPVLSRIRAQETDLPAAIELGFTEAESEYGRAVVGSRRLVGTSRRELAVDTALVLRSGEAQRLADVKLQTLWADRETVSFALSPRAAALEPGDVVALDGAPQLYRIERIAEGAARRIEAREVEPASLTSRTIDARGIRRRRPGLSVGPPMAVVLDLPATGDAPEVLQHLAVAAQPWPGRIAVHRAAPGGLPSLHRVVDVPAVIGRTTAPFGAGPVWRWDARNVLEVELSSGSFASLGDDETLAGGNLLAVLGAEGACEVLSARDAELVGERRFRLSRLLRGLGGTEHLASRSLAAGMTVVQLDDAVVPLATSLAEISQSWTYRIGPAGQDLTDASYETIETTTTGHALAPLAPVQVRARRTGAGIELRWIRRTRLDGDGWGLVEVPLAEEIEAYEVDILSGASVVRTIAASEPIILYPAASEIADFGASQVTLTLRVQQLSRTIGRGRAAALILSVE